MTATPQLLNCRKDLLAHDGEIVSVAGVYQAINLEPHYMAQVEPNGTVTTTSVIARLKLEDTRVILGIRPAAELVAFDDKTVIAVGRIEADPQLVPGMAQQVPRPLLHDIQSVSLLPE